MTGWRGALARLGAGSAAAAWWLARWPWAAEGWKARSGRLIWYAVLGWCGWRIVGAHRVVVVVLAAGWLVAAWRAGGPTASDEPDGSPMPDEASDDAAAVFLLQLHQLLAEASGVHLVQVAEQLLGDPAATGRVRELCAAAGVPVNRGVRVPGREVSTGIRKQDLPPPPPATRSGPVAVVTAGQPEQQQPTARIVPDPGGNPHRWVVEWE